MKGRIPLYYGDNGVHEFYENSCSNVVIIRNHNESCWCCLKVMDKLTPVDFQRADRNGVHPLLAHKSLTVLLQRIKRQYRVTTEIDNSHKWFPDSNGRMILFGVEEKEVATCK